MLGLHEPLNKKLKCRVELHIHLEASIRHETIWELLRKKSLPTPGDGSLTDLKYALKIHEPNDLFAYISKLDMYLPALRGDLEAVERIAFEFAEDQARQCVAYSEVRVIPYDFLSSTNGTGECINGENGTVVRDSIASDDVLEAMLKGFKAAEEKYETKIRVIIFVYPKYIDYLSDALRLCEEFKDKGVVGIDFALFEDYLKDSNEEPMESSTASEIIKAFESAREKGIHRTIHAGEYGSAKGVQQAISLLGAERIGHGYRVLEDEDIYQKCLADGIHFEMCPHSSYLTGTINQLNLKSKRHPILRLAEDNASFSISSDSTTLCMGNLENEYELLRKWGFNEAHITTANFQAALHSFLPPEEKLDLINLLKTNYGFIDYALPISPSESSSSSSVVSTLEKGAKTKVKKPEIKIGAWGDR